MIVLKKVGDRYQVSRAAAPRLTPEQCEETLGVSFAEFCEQVEVEEETMQSILTAALEDEGELDEWLEVQV